MGKDGSVVMVGSAQKESNELAAVKLDAEGNFLWEWQVTDMPVLSVFVYVGSMKVFVSTSCLFYDLRDCSKTRSGVSAVH